MARRYRMAALRHWVQAGTLALIVSGCAAPNPKADLRFIRAELVGDNTYVSTRVREKALTLRYASRMQGLEGKSIPVRVYLTQGGKTELISDLDWQPGAKDRDWQWVVAYVPLSRLFNAWSVDFTAVAVSPDAPDGYFDRVNTLVDFYHLNHGLMDGLWGLEKFEDDVDLGADQRGVRCAFWFDAGPRQSHSFRASLVVMNTRTLKTMQTPSTTFAVGSGSRSFEHIAFEARYADIAATLGAAEGDDLIFYPLAQWDDGRETSNIYVDGYAFGDPKVVIARLENARDEAARQAANIEQTLELLKQAGY
jgi:hypothetical protein